MVDVSNLCGKVEPGLESRASAASALLLLAVDGCCAWEEATTSGLLMAGAFSLKLLTPGFDCVCAKEDLAGLILLLLGAAGITS